MADTYTTNLNLTKPEPGAAEDTWGISLNADLDALDAIFSSSGTQINLNPNQVNFADNKKAVFGTGSDLEIYHDGSNSNIVDTGTGYLSLRGTDLRLQDSTGWNFVICTDLGQGGEVALLHSNIQKLKTTSTGIDVTGTVTSDALKIVNSTTSNISLMEDGSSGADIKYIGSNNNFVIATGTGGAGSQTQRLSIQRDTGDISFYDDTGTTQGLFWDASTERLGIGATSPSEKLTVAGIVKSNGFSTNTAGVSNFIAGVNAGSSIISGGEYNTLIGDEAGASITTGDFNVAVGNFALDANTTSSENTAIGYASLSNNITGARNVASGFRALQLSLIHI